MRANGNRVVVHEGERIITPLVLLFLGMEDKLPMIVGFGAIYVAYGTHGCLRPILLRIWNVVLYVVYYF
jgi:hypothetical protein